MTLPPLSPLPPTLTPDAVAGLVVASVCFLLALRNMVGAVWPEPFEKYRRLALAAAFLLLTSWSAAGLSGINSAFWAVVNFGTFVAIFGGCAWLLRAWARNIPLPDQRFELRGVGLVTVLEVSSEIPIDARVTYKDARGNRHVVSAMRFIAQAELQALVVPNVERR